MHTHTLQRAAVRYFSAFLFFTAFLSLPARSCLSEFFPLPAGAACGETGGIPVPARCVTTGGPSVEFPSRQGDPSAQTRRIDPMPISEARMNDSAGVALRLGSLVVVRGIVTVGAEHGAPAVMQDSTGGIAAYDAAFCDSVVIGDDVTISGRVTQYNGLTELTEVTILDRHGGGKAVAPRGVTIAELLADGVNGVEQFEELLVRISGVTVNTLEWSVSGPGTNYLLSDGANTLTVRVDNDVDFAGMQAPFQRFDIVGVVGQYRTAPPFIGGYQLLPRRADDILVAGPGITAIPAETAIAPDAVTLQWSTALNASAFVLCGKSDAMELGITAGSAGSTAQSVTIGGLEPATIYRVRPFSVASGDTSVARDLFIVSAALSSTGEVHAYFNQSVAALYPPLPARGNAELERILIARLDGARHSIDACLYSLSGAVGAEVAGAILRAQSRGVRVRMIFENDNAGSDAIRTVRAAIPTILDDFDPVNAGAGLMHNKFFVIDARDRSSDRDDWLITGSWNPTDAGTNDDAQNIVEIQDQSLAAVFTKEFEEMWGSGTETPSSAATRFGARKTDDTPHRVFAGGSFIDVYFSPSDGANRYLLQSIARARGSVCGAIFTFTREDLAEAMVQAADRGCAVRLVIDNSAGAETRYDYLAANGIDILVKSRLAGYLHHKYLLLDTEAPQDAYHPLCITGSHNWTNAAERVNDENLLGIRRGDIGIQFLQEWHQRYTDAGGRAVITLEVRAAVQTETASRAGTAFPNPVSISSSGAVTIPFSTGARGNALELVLCDGLGREKWRMADIPVRTEASRATIRSSALSPGVYFYRLSDGKSSANGRLVVIP